MRSRKKQNISLFSVLVSCRGQLACAKHVAPDIKSRPERFCSFCFGFFVVFSLCRGAWETDGCRCQVNLKSKKVVCDPNMTWLLKQFSHASCRQKSRLDFFRIAIFRFSKFVRVEILNFVGYKRAPEGRAQTFCECSIIFQKFMKFSSRLGYIGHRCLPQLDMDLTSKRIHRQNANLTRLLKEFFESHFNTWLL